MLIRIMILIIFLSKESQLIKGAQIEQFPYHASIRYRSAQVCGGAILTGKMILTAAHCKIPKVRKFYQTTLKIFLRF